MGASAAIALSLLLVMAPATVRAALSVRPRREVALSDVSLGTGDASSSVTGGASSSATGTTSSSQAAPGVGDEPAFPAGSNYAGRPASVMGMGVRPAGPAVGIAASAGGGYWIVSRNGAVTNFGSAPALGSPTLPAKSGGAVAITATPDGRGYWILDRKGAVFAAGDARWYGSLARAPLGRPVSGLAPTLDGRGYLIVDVSGEVFAYGDAAVRGSLVAPPAGSSIIAITTDPLTGGYWLTATNGSTFAFGAPKLDLGGPALAVARRGGVSALAVSPAASVGWLAGRDGQVVRSGPDAELVSPLAPDALGGPIVAATSIIAGRGYLLMSSTGQVFAAGAATSLGGLRSAAVAGQLFPSSTLA
ncbi:MAG: hypothetical protein ACRDZ5_10740, partial [Acidimicrobiales bacterium]